MAGARFARLLNAADPENVCPVGVVREDEGEARDALRVIGWDDGLIDIEIAAVRVVDEARLILRQAEVARAIARRPCKPAGGGQGGLRMPDVVTPVERVVGFRN